MAAVTPPEQTGRLQISMSLVPGPLTRPILAGAVAPQGVTVSLNESKTVDGNSRRMLDLAYDVAEMSLATFLKAREQGTPLIGLPLFTGRRFLQPCVLVSASSGIQSPAELRGKRVGLPQFWMTSSVWHRGILQQQHGVGQNEVAWQTISEERFDNLNTPSNVTLRSVATDGSGPPDRGLDLLLLDGELDATMTPRPGGELARRDSRVRQPYSDLARTQREYFQSTGVYPIMHFVVMREELNQQQPWLAETLCTAFQAAKDHAIASGEGPGAPIAGDTPEDAEAVFGSDPWAFGLSRNRRTLETFVDFATTQGLLDQPAAIDDLFVPSTRNLFD
jgi:4,5-dihydroxyphthalate decarboxylase